LIHEIAAMVVPYSLGADRQCEPREGRGYGGRQGMRADAAAPSFGA
jgi:hypothetical protein